MARLCAPDSLLTIVRKVAALSAIYWDDACFPKAFCEAENNWLAALSQLVAGYLYERQGAPVAYKTMAKEALVAAGSRLREPTARFCKDVWTRFRKLAVQRDIGANAKLNPLAYEGETSEPIAATAFVASLAGHNFNVLRWATQQLSFGEAASAAENLGRIRGVGVKLASFYLRDVAKHAGIEEHAHGQELYFQPVDRWVRRIAILWGAMVQPSVDIRDDGSEDERAAQLFVNLARLARVRGGDLNAGAWILGSQILDGDPGIVVRELAALDRCLMKSLVWHQTFARILAPLLGK